MTSIRERYPAPWRAVEMDGGGWRVVSANDVSVAVIYGHPQALAARSSRPGAVAPYVTPAEAKAIAQAIAKLPGLMGGE